MQVRRYVLGATLCAVAVACGDDGKPVDVTATPVTATPVTTAPLADGVQELAPAPFAFPDPPFRPLVIEEQAHHDDVAQEQLDRLAAKLRVRDLKSFRGLLAADFLGRPPRWSDGGEAVLDGPAFVEVWHRELAAWRRLRDVSLHLDVARHDADGGFVAVVSYSLVGMAPSGDEVELVGEARLRAVRTGSRSFVLDRWEPRAGERRLRRHGFVRHHHEVGLHPLDSHEERQGPDPAGHAALVVGDVDGDGAFDVFAPGLRTSALFVRRGTRFVEEAEARGLEGERGGVGGVFCDLDGDGADDLFVTKLGHREVDGSTRGEPSCAYLWRDGRFVAGPSSLELALPSYVAVPFDHDLDGDLDLFVGGYGVPLVGLGTRSGRGAEDALLVRTERGWRDRARDLRVNSRGWTRAASAFDHDQDGDLDLFVVNEEGTDRFFENRPEDELFVDLATSGVWAKSRRGSSTVALEDVDGDGRIELVGEFCRGQAHVCGTGVLAPHRDFAHTTLPEPGEQWSLLGGDFDLDGRVDLLTLGRARNDHQGEHT